MKEACVTFLQILTENRKGEARTQQISQASAEAEIKTKHYKTKIRLVRNAPSRRLPRAQAL